MEKALYITKLTARMDEYCKPEFTRLYFGNEFCARLLPSTNELRKALKFVNERKMDFTLLTPYAAESELAAVDALLEVLVREKPGSEVVFNDWGVLWTIKKIRRLKPVMGRLLNKMKRGPRFMLFMKELPRDTVRYLKSSNLTVPAFRKFLLKNGIRRVELDNVLQGIDLNFSDSGLMASLHIPYVYVTTTRLCLASLCEIPENKFVVGIFPCNMECRKYTFYMTNPVMPLTLIRKGNTIFFKNDKLPNHLEDGGINRIVYSPEIPI